MLVHLPRGHKTEDLAAACWLTARLCRLYYLIVGRKHANEHWLLLNEEFDAQKNHTQ